MIAEKMAEKALILLGYGDIEDNMQRYQRIALSAINSVCADLAYIWNIEFCEIAGLDGEITLNERVLNDVMPYGVAAFIAKSMGDGDSQIYFAEMYNLKRKKLSRESAVKDVLPIV